MSGAAIADRNACRGMGKPLARARCRNSKAFQVPTLCAMTCAHDLCVSLEVARHDMGC